MVLEPTTEYVISLRATNNVGDGQQAYANVRTPERFVSESAVPLIPPVGLKAIVLSATTVVLYWTDTTLSKSQVRFYSHIIYSSRLCREDDARKENVKQKNL